MPTNKPLTTSQHLVLGTASERSDRMVLPLPPALRVRGATQRQLLAGLLKAGLVEEIPADRDGLCWRKDNTGQRVALRLTEVGMLAVDAVEQPLGASRPRATPATAASAEPTSAPQQVPKPQPDTRGTRRGAPGYGRGRATVAAPSREMVPARTASDADAGATPDVAGAHAPDDASAASARPEEARASPGGKLGRVLDALSTADGATLAEIVALTGWQPHSARAALTGLRQRGFAIRLAADGTGRKAYRASRAALA